jgi:hypothetical protein
MSTALAPAVGYSKSGTSITMASMTLPFPPRPYADTVSRAPHPGRGREANQGRRQQPPRPPGFKLIPELNPGGAASVLVYSDPMKLAANRPARLAIAVCAGRMPMWIKWRRVEAATSCGAGIGALLAASEGAPRHSRESMRSRPA